MLEQEIESQFGSKCSKSKVFLFFVLFFCFRGESSLIISGLMSVSYSKVFPEKMEEKDLIRSQSALCGHWKKNKGRGGLLPLNRKPADSKKMIFFNFTPYFCPVLFLTTVDVTSSAKWTTCTVKWTQRSHSGICTGFNGTEMPIQYIMIISNQTLLISCHELNLKECLC